MFQEMSNKDTSPSFKPVRFPYLQISVEMFCTKFTEPRFSAVDERTRYIRGFYVQLLCYHFHDNLKVKS